MTKIILIGAGGHSKVIQDMIAVQQNYELYAVLDDAFEQMEMKDGIIQAHTSFLDELDMEEYKFCIAIGHNATRKRLFEHFSIPIGQYATIIHHSAVVSATASIGYGTVILPNAVINANAVIGDHGIINTNAVVEHDNELADYVHISPSATLSGTVTVEEGAHIGTNATVIPQQLIGKWTTIGAGAVVINHIKDYATAVGIPAKIIRRGGVFSAKGRKDFSLSTTYERK